MPENCSGKVSSKTAAARSLDRVDNTAPVTFMGGAAQLRRHTPHPERCDCGQAAKGIFHMDPPQGKANQQREQHESQTNRNKMHKRSQTLD